MPRQIDVILQPFDPGQVTSSAPGAAPSEPSPGPSSATENGAAAEPTWLDPEERLTWLALNALLVSLPASIEAQLGRDAGLTYFEYTVLAALSEHEDRTLRMSELALLANGSLSRLSHVARRLETRGYVQRRPLPHDGRTTIAILTDAGMEVVRSAAPAHTAHVRHQIFDVLDPDENRELGRIVHKLAEHLDPVMATAARRTAEENAATAG